MTDIIASVELTDLLADEELTDDALTRDFRIWQRRRGHRYSLDDVATAWQAAEARPAARRYLDLGCGIGSVLLMVAWKLKTTHAVGIEAQPLSAALARRNVLHNGLEGRVVVVEGDLREVVATRTDRFELVSGTPPYLPLGTALHSPDPQRAAARMELRGGIEAYLAAAASVLSEDGRVVVCADGRHPERVTCGAAAAGLVPLLRRDAIARAGAAEPLFSVWTLAREGCAEGAVLRHESLLIRDASGGQTEQARALRGFFGLGLG